MSVGGLLSLAGYSDNEAIGGQVMASSFAQLANSYINYNALKVEAGGLNLQADAVELEAQEQANALRKQFIGAIGNATYNAAARGVKTSSANLQQNIERSAGEMDEDIRKSKKNASMKAATLRTQAKIAKRAAKAELVSGTLGTISDLAAGFAMYNMPENMGGTKQVTKDGKITGNIPVPSRKPTRG